MLTFAAAVFLLIITPGPGVLSAAGMGSAYGFRPGLRYVTGLFLGNNLVALTVISGLAAIVMSAPVVRTVLMIASVGYLLYLAGRIAFAGSRVAFVEAKAPPGVPTGLMLQIINPKAYAVNTALFSGFAFYPDSLLVETVTKLLVFNAIWIPIHLVWLYAGVVLHRLDLGEAAHRRINMAMALAMLGVVVLAIWSGLGGRG
ncbi:LysE family translocator [Phaeobacter marinintestinus]|uniref:LysE family translocator n=1 Tax=Falsiphaeobacter marinintestinus TaxID=1492905 RepID=UPI0011B52024|nr:LysE family translocator [Phaeobacter marinintestinus]